MDINTKILKKNAFRVTKERGMTASRIRVPGGHLDAKYLSQIQHIAETFGNGTVHITSRQGFEIPGIPFEKMPEVNAALQSLIDGLEKNKKSQVLVRYVIQMCRTLNRMIPIAEGIETEGQIDILKNLGCDFGQGYYFSKPISVKDFFHRYMLTR